MSEIESKNYSEKLDEILYEIKELKQELKKNEDLQFLSKLEMVNFAV